MPHFQNRAMSDSLFPMDNLEPLTVKVNIPQVDIAPLFPLPISIIPISGMHQEILNLVSPLTKTLSPKTDVKFVKKFTQPNFRVKDFYTRKTRKSRLFLPAINSKNASLSVIWPSFG